MPSENATERRENSTERRIVYVLVAVGILTFLYSVLIASRPLAWFWIAISLVVVYLLWRFVRAVERIADAQERDSETQTERVEERRS